jgi:hydroxyacylglutathione hydrolase
MLEPVTRIDLGFVNAYLLAGGGGFVLVDTGMKGHHRRIVEALRKAGAGPGRLSLIVLTHADMDHAGNCLRLKSEYRVPIAAHAADARVLELGSQPVRTGRTPGARMAMKLLALARRPGRTTPARGSFSPDVILRDGERLERWGLAARVVHLPGHTGGSIAVLTDGGALIAGDACTNARRPEPSPFIENVEDYRSSLAVMRGLATSVKRVYPGHGSPFDGNLLSTLSL